MADAANIMPESANKLKDMYSPVPLRKVLAYSEDIRRTKAVAMRKNRLKNKAKPSSTYMPPKAAMGSVTSIAKLPRRMAASPMAETLPSHDL